MIPPRNILIAAIAAVFGLTPLSGAAPAATPTTNPADSIRQAADPSAAVAAFVVAAKADPQNTDIEQAFVHRMVELGAPELADAQARDLTNRNAADALTRAAEVVRIVLRACGAESGEAPEAPDDLHAPAQRALSDKTAAGEQAPEENPRTKPEQGERAP